MVHRNAVMRVARPTDNLQTIAAMYAQGLGFEVLSRFENHEGFDGVILGHEQHSYHLEFTHHHETRVGRAPTPDNLLVFYLPDQDAWRSQCQQMIKAGFTAVKSFNPYWEISGRTFADADGYRVVLQNEEWSQ